jgi:hypothetical protein
MRYENFAGEVHPRRICFRRTRGSLTEWTPTACFCSASACQESFDHPSELLRMLARRQVPALGEHS